MRALAWVERVDWFTVAKTASLVAALALVAQSEWTLALAVGWPTWIAWAAFVALDSYILASIRARRDLGPSVIVSAASVLGSHAVYAAPSAWASGAPGQGHLVWQLAAACSVVPLLVTWRVHHLHLPEAVKAADPAEEIAVNAEAPPALSGSQVPPRSLPAQVAPAATIPGLPPQPTQPITVPDAELAAIIAANPTAGFPTITKAIKDAGWLVGNTQRVKDAIRAHKTSPSLRVVAGGQ